MITLDRLANVLGGYGGRLWTRPRGRDVELRSVAVYDRCDSRDASGDVLLAVGLNDAATAVRAAVAAHARVLVLRTESSTDAAGPAGADEHGIAVLAIEPAMSFSQVTAVVYGLVLEGEETEAGRGPTDLFTLADTLAEKVGAAVTVENHHSQVLAYSSKQAGADRARTETILGRNVPDEVAEALAGQGVFEHIATSDEPLFVPPSGKHGLKGRTVIAVRAGRSLLGSIWVETHEPLGTAARTALVDGAGAAALQMLRSRASADLERQVESDCVTRLLQGDADSLALLGQLGLPHGPAPCFRVIAVRTHGGDSQQAAALLTFERATLGFGWARPGRSGLFGNTVYTIMHGADDPSCAREWADGLIAALPKGLSASAGIGGTADVTELPASRKEADESLAVHALHSGAGSAVTYDDAWDEILLERLRAVARSGREPTRGPVFELGRHDERNGTRFVPTLRAWLRAQGDIGVTARALGVHRNTIRYRLNQMAEITELHLDDPRRRLAMIIALTASEPR